MKENNEEKKCSNTVSKEWILSALTGWLFLGIFVWLFLGFYKESGEQKGRAIPLTSGHYYTIETIIESIEENIEEKTVIAKMDEEDKPRYYLIDSSCLSFQLPVKIFVFQKDKESPAECFKVSF